MTNKMGAYFDDLTPKQQLNDLMHKYAQANGGDYGSGWRELETRYFRETGVELSIMKWQYELNIQFKMTMPVFLEASGWLPRAIKIGHKMIGRTQNDPKY